MKTVTRFNSPPWWRTLATLAAMVCFENLSMCQSPTFSQFYANPMIINPAYASTVKGCAFTMGYRQQWGQIQKGLSTMYAGTAMQLCELPLAFGMSIAQVKDPFFGYRQQEVNFLTSAYLAPTEKFSLHGGLQAGLGQTRIDYEQLLFSGQLDPVFGIVEEPSGQFLGDGSRVNTFDIGAGVAGRGVLTFKGREWPASLGVAVTSLGGSRNISFLHQDTKRAQRWQVHGSVTSPIKGGLLHKEVLYLHWISRFELESRLQKTTTGVIAQLNGGHAGLLYHWNKSPITNQNTNALSLVIGGRFKLGASLCNLNLAYDGIVSGLGQAASHGSYELIATFDLESVCLFKGKNRRGSTECFQFGGKGYKKFLN